MKLKTSYSSYSINQLPTGCKYCIKGKKLVIFISGICSRDCYYCSLSDKRKNKDIIWANERICKSSKDLIKEAVESNATSAGITGGDPLLFLNRTIRYAKALKNRFGRRFHIHIYLPTKLVEKNNLKKLSEYIDEVRFHPEFLINPDSKIKYQDINKIILANQFWKKENIGMELPIIPEKKKEILDFIIKISPHIGFVNLNEFELSETNFNILTKRYKFNDSGYVVKDSKKAGLWILSNLKKQKSRLKIHFCTAELKNNHQFKNRLLRHRILPFGKRTKNGLVLYLTTNKKPKSKPKKDYFFDKLKRRYILSESLAKKLLGKQKIFLVEEFPTYDRIELEKEELK